MPYPKNNDLPDSVKDNLPQHAQDIYREAFNSAWDQYSDRHDREGVSHAVAWTAVENKYHKNKQGEWVTNEAAG
jgi:cation transport regulator